MDDSSGSKSEIENEPAKPFNRNLELSAESPTNVSTSKEKSKRKYAKIGTFDDPIVVVRDSVERKDLLEVLSDEYYKDKDVELKKTTINYNKWGGDDRDWYILNVIYNKLLTPIDVKLALFLYERMRLNSYSYTGLLCNVRDSKEPISLDRHYGGDNGIYILDDYHFNEPSLYYYQDMTNLVAIFNEIHNYEIPTKNVMKSLNRLHDFGYITLTKISRENQKSFKRMKCSDIGEVRPRLVHLRLLRWMIHNKVFDKFNWE